MKLLLVLLVIALASFLLVGCFGVPDGTEGEDEDEGEVGICPTVAVSGEVVIDTKNYLKAGKHTITVTFAVPTEPVSVYVGADLKSLELLLTTYEVTMYPNADKTVYTGTFTFGKSEGYEDCSDAYIYVETCGTCVPCKYPYTVDSVGPESLIIVKAAPCTVCPAAGFCDITFKTYAPSLICEDVYCGDACSGFASYEIQLYTDLPFDLCCDTSCAIAAYTATGTACPVNGTLRVVGTKIVDDKIYYSVVTLLDKVGNRTRYYAKLVLDSACGLTVTEYLNATGKLCSDYSTNVTTTAVAVGGTGSIGVFTGDL